ncbi:Protein NETWORKED 2D [Dichanthelium oligosanthes]|uniref:Protein NETWORKED 2D n=1 Tax=Dichanthelium oligosanthes TaxID=888268 RepID=A0A1E5VMB7_9POAL|nr:Protein NETWORKED 2D [Dichanthelium oligosanthes]
MLQRAASNAYSWWWASHIRTTQSKWLDANLQGQFRSPLLFRLISIPPHPLPLPLPCDWIGLDAPSADMENRVKIMLKLLGQEADSFGKRAEMYYRTRPEVISHVEQVYRAYRALVERYDHISKELHKANHTIATACPEEVQYAMLEEEDEGDLPKAITPINSHKIHKSTVEEILNRKRQGPSGRNKPASALHITTEEAQEEISRLQKAILVLQTEKEYVKSSYESGIARYWEIEKQIADTQEEICLIQDKFDAHAAIHDDEARALMTIAALRSCQGTISRLVRHFEELIRIAAMELEKTKSLRAQLYAMNGNTDTSSREASSTDTSMNTRAYAVTQRILELQPTYEKIDNFFANGSESSAEEIADNVDELVDKVVNLELRFPKQSAQINQLKQENKNLKNKLDELQDEMALRDDQSDLNAQLKRLEDELSRVQLLERSITEEEVSVNKGFSELFNCIINISKALGSVGPEDLSNLLTAVGDGATASTDMFLEYFTEGSKVGKFRDVEAPTLSDRLGQDREDISEVVNGNGNDGIHGFKNGDEQKFLTENCLMQLVRNKMSIHSDNHIDPFVSSENESGADNAGEGNADSSSEEICQGSSENENGSGYFAQGKILKGEYALGMVSQTHLLCSGSIDTLDKKYESNEQGSSTEASESLMEVAEGSISEGNAFTGSSVVQEERLGDSKSQNIGGQISPVASSDSYTLKENDPLEESSFPEATCSSGAGKSPDSQHTNEATYVEELPSQGGHLNAPQNIGSLNRCSQVVSPKEDGCISLGHVDNIQDMKNGINVDVYSSDVRDENSPLVPAGDSEETEGLYGQVLDVLTDSENMASDIHYSQLEEKSSDGKELASKATNSNNHGGRSQGEKAAMMGEESVPSWQEFLLDGLEGREAILLADYTSVLQNYKETKRRLTELEKKNQEHLDETKAVIRELRNANSMKGIDRSNCILDGEISTLEESSFSNMEAQENTSLFQVRFRNDIDTLVEENLQFLVRYSMACHHMQEFDRRYQEVQKEMEGIEDKETRGSYTAAEPEPAEKKLRELRTELDVWFEQNALLDQEVQLKSASLCRLQEEIAEALRGGSEMVGARFTPYEAAKFQGEVLNMQQSNSKIESELQVASEHMRGLQAKLNDALRELRESFEISSRRLSRPETESSYEKQFKHFPSRTRVPLRNFLFGTKRKKKSIFACINPTLEKQFSDL